MLPWGIKNDTKSTTDLGIGFVITPKTRTNGSIDLNLFADEISEPDLIGTTRISYIRVSMKYLCNPMKAPYEDGPEYQYPTASHTSKCRRVLNN